MPDKWERDRRRRVDLKRIDPKMRRLVRALNSLPGIYTTGSCGGHRRPSICQEPADRWYVVLHVDGRKGGEASLRIIAYVAGWAICQFGNTHAVELVAQAESPEGPLLFHLQGQRPPTADQVAALLTPRRTDDD